MAVSIFVARSVFNMSVNSKTVKYDVLEQLTLPELIDLWAEDEIYRRLQEVDLFSATIVREAQRQQNLMVMQEWTGLLLVW